MQQTQSIWQRSNVFDDRWNVPAHCTADVLLQREYFNREEILQLPCRAIHRVQRWPAVTHGDTHAIERHSRLEGFHGLWPWRRDRAFACMQLDLAGTEQGSKDVPRRIFAPSIRRLSKLILDGFPLDAP